MPDAEPILVDPELAAFMEGGISLNLASCSRANMPSVARAIGCRVTDAGRTVRLLVSQQQAAQVLGHVRETGAIAAVISDPATHRTFQFKGRAARIEAAGAADLQAVHLYRQNFPAHLERLGYPPISIRAFLMCPDEDVVAIAFEPGSAFTQTPGASAGHALKGGQ